jgi:hypothetical protein
VEPTLTSGVFKFTGIMMNILDRASYAAKQWTDQLAKSAVIGQDLYLTISHPQRDEGEKRNLSTFGFTSLFDPTKLRERAYLNNYLSLRKGEKTFFLIAFFSFLKKLFPHFISSLPQYENDLENKCTTYVNLSTFFLFSLFIYFY